MTLLCLEVFRSCPISLPKRVTWADFVELDMVYFDDILGMDWLHIFFASIDCRIRLVNFIFPNEHILECKGLIQFIEFISYVL